MCILYQIERILNQYGPVVLPDAPLRDLTNLPIRVLHATYTTTLLLLPNMYHRFEYSRTLVDMWFYILNKSERSELMKRRVDKMNFVMRTCILSKFLAYMQKCIEDEL